MTEDEKKYQVTNAAYIDRLHTEAMRYIKQIEALKAENDRLLNENEELRRRPQGDLGKRVEAYLDENLSPVGQSRIERLEAENARLRRQIEMENSEFLAQKVNDEWARVWDTERAKLNGWIEQKREECNRLQARVEALRSIHEVIRDMPVSEDHGARELSWAILLQDDRAAG